MSMWTHVVATFRFEGLYFYGMKKEGCKTPEEFADKICGKILLWEDPSEVYEEYDKNPEAFCPTGSEGSLQRVIFTEPPEDNCYTMADSVISYFGDLRDFDSAQEIIDWFKSCIIKYPSVRQANCLAESEFGETIIANYCMNDRKIHTQKIEIEKDY